MVAWLTGDFPLEDSPGNKGTPHPVTSAHKHACWSSRKVLIVVVHFNQNWNVLTDVSKTTQFHENSFSCSPSCYVQTERQTEW
jgi:hypothetical protein